jgi:hypothetical protein
VQTLNPALSQVLELPARGAPETHAKALRGVLEPDLIAACHGGVKVSAPGPAGGQAGGKGQQEEGERLNIPGSL